MTAEAGTGGAGRAARVGGLAGALVSLVALVAVVWWASEQGTPRFPTRAEDLLLIVAAVALYAAATLARGRRWHVILRNAGIRHDAVDAYALVPVGYMGNAVLPARGGELLRIFLLGARTDARRREVLGTIVTERLLDAVTLGLLFVALTLAGIAGSPVGERPAIAAAAVIVCGVVAVMAYLALRSRGRFERFAARIRPVAGASRQLFGLRGALLVTGTLAIWLIEGAIFWLVGASLDVDVSLVEAAFLLVLASFFSLVPAAPGYVGTFDAAVVFGLEALDVAGGQALAYALLVRFVLFVPIAVTGLIVLVVRYGGLAQLRARRVRPAGDEER